jgi:predicted DNA-binding transcriptional regulator AlpA
VNQSAEPAIRLVPADLEPATTVEDQASHPEAGRPTSRAPAAELPPLLVDITGLSELLQRSVASLYRDDAAGRLPAGLKLGASKRWRYSEILAWVDAGMPDRRTWEAMKSANGRHRH